MKDIKQPFAYNYEVNIKLGDTVEKYQNDIAQLPSGAIFQAADYIDDKLFALRFSKSI